MKTVRALLLVAVTVMLAAVALDYTQSREVDLEYSRGAPEAIPSNLDSQSRRWNWSQSSADHPKVEMHADTARVVRNSALLELQGVELKVFQGDERTFDRIECKSARFDGETMYSEGEVIVFLDLSMDETQPAKKPTTIRTSGVTFHSSNATCSTERQTEYEFDGGFGHSMGAYYDSVNRYFQMKSKAYLERFGASNAPPVRIRAGELFYHETAQRVDLRKGAVLQRGAQQMEAAEATVFLEDGIIRRIAATQSVGTERQNNRQISFQSPALQAWYSTQQVLERVTGAGPSEMISESASSTAKVTGQHVDLFYALPPGADDSALHEVFLKEAGRIEVLPKSESEGKRIIAADSIRLGMRAGGEDIEVVETLSPGTIELQSAAPGGSKRRVEGDRINAYYQPGNRMERLQVMGHVAMESHPANAPAEEKQPPLRTWSDGMIAEFDATSGEMQVLKQWADFRFEQGERRGQAGEARFEVAGNRIDLTGDAQVWDAAGKTSGHHLILDDDSGRFTAEIGVATQYAEPAKPSIEEPTSVEGLFSGDEPVFAIAGRMVSDQATGMLRYHDRARLWQGSNQVEADGVEIDRRAHSLSAAGNVVSLLLEEASRDEAAGASKNPQGAARLIEIRADSMKYEESTRRALYKGSVRMKRHGLTVHSDEMEVFFHASGGKQEDDGRLRRAVARGNVAILEQQGPAREGRRGAGQYAEYFPRSEKVILRGSPARVHGAQRDETRGSELTYYLDDDRLLVQGNETDPSYTYRRAR